jgi:hypothetical protein
MDLNRDISVWNNPLKDIASGYWQNGICTDNGGMIQVTLTHEELMAVVSYMILGMNKVEAIKEERK